MDDSTLTGLKAAFASGPSAELAKIIISQCLIRQDYDAIQKVLAGLPAPFKEDDAADLARQFIEKKLYRLAKQVLVPEVPQHQQLLSEIADIEAAENSSEAEKRPKLKIVEKVDMAEVIDLRRYKQSATNFDDVVGLKEIKKQINKRIILPFQKPSLYQRFRKKVGGGVLLYGPPGCGKTLLARATAGECNANFFNIEISDVLDMYIGESEQKLKAIFEKARAESPSVLFFDELEALAGKREHMRNSAQSNCISQFLTELDGFSQYNSGVLVLGSTNVPWSVDSAFLRPGRFDRMFFVPPPDKEARQSIIEHHMKERPKEANIDYENLALKTPGYSGADLANLVEMAVDEAIEQSLEQGEDIKISMNHFVEAVKLSRSTTTEWLTTARNYARYANDGGRYDDVLNFLKKHGA